MQSLFIYLSNSAQNRSSQVQRFVTLGSTCQIEQNIISVLYALATYTQNLVELLKATYIAIHIRDPILYPLFHYQLIGY